MIMMMMIHSSIMRDSRRRQKGWSYLRFFLRMIMVVRCYRWYYLLSRVWQGRLDCVCLSEQWSEARLFFSKFVWNTWPVKYCLMVSGIVFSGCFGDRGIGDGGLSHTVKAVSLTRVVARSSTKESSAAFHRLLACLLLDPWGANIVR